jgi:6-pyruvoyl-tetrahydropterin synthase
VRTSTISIRHNFETAHRLPRLPGKCQNIHGHSWTVEWRFEVELDQNGMGPDYSWLKCVLREWVDTYLDHGAMLGLEDPLADAFRELNLKVWVFDPDHAYTLEFPWPTVEATANLLAKMAYSKTGLTCTTTVREGLSGNEATGA